MKIFHSETKDDEIFLGEILMDKPFDEIYKLFQVMYKDNMIKNNKII